MDNIKEVNDSTWGLINTKDYVIVKFYKENCGPCKVVATQLDRMLRASGIKVIAYNYDAGHNSEKALELQIMALPTLILYKDGKEITRASGVSSVQIIRDILEKEKT